MAIQTPPLTPEQQKAIAIIPKFTAAFSLIGSMFIAIHILRSKKRLGRIYHRILLGLSAMDIVSSFKSFLSTWPIPSGMTYGAVGTVQTCTAAGFLGHGSSLASALYNGSLTLYFLLTINYGWRSGQFRKLEPWMHAIPLGVGWGTAIAGIPLLLYNSIGWTCWIAPVPVDCKQTHQYGYTTCIRGDNAYVYRWAFFHAFIWLTFFLTAASMICIYQHVRNRERASASYRISRDKQQKSQSRLVANQAMFYVGAYYLTWIFPTITWTTQLISGKTYTAILFLQAIFVPLQGWFNAFIYFRPRYLNFKKQHSELTSWQILTNIIARKSCFWNTSPARRQDSDSFDASSLNHQSSRQGSLALADGQVVAKDANHGSNGNFKRKETSEHDSTRDDDASSEISGNEKEACGEDIDSFLGRSERRQSSTVRMKQDDDNGDSV